MKNCRHLHTDILFFPPIKIIPIIRPPVLCFRDTISEAKTLVTHQHEETGQQEVDQVPQKGREPEVGQVDSADLLHMLGLDGGLSDQQQSKGAGQGGHAVHQVDGDGEARLLPLDLRGQERKMCRL